MTLPSSGPIYLSQVNTELGRPWNQWITMNDGDVRRLAGAPSGPVWMSWLHGKSNIIREPASGEYAQRLYSSWDGLGSSFTISWFGARLASVHYTVTSHTIGVWTYFKGSQHAIPTDDGMGNVGFIYYYGIWRTRLGP